MRFKVFSMFFMFIFGIQNNAQSTASKQVKSFELSAPQLDTTKTIWVYLPKNYQNSRKRYPVTYMHDGQNLFDAKTSYAGEWQVDKYLDGIDNKKSIVVGIEHGNEKRIDELTPFRHEKYGGGKGDAYIDFIKNELKPHIDSLYRTKLKAKHTTLFGSSLGGLISFYGTIKYPQTFGNAGVFSPSFWINPEIYEFVNNSEINKNLKFYFLCGTKEGESTVPDQQKMVELLKSKGIKENQIKNQIIEGGEHNEAFWSEHFDKAYQWLINKY